MTNDNILFRHKLQLVNAYRSARRTLGILLLLRRLEDLMLSQFLQVSYPQNNLKACGGIQFFARLITVAAANLI